MGRNNFITRVDVAYRRKNSENRYRREKRAELSEALKKYRKELYNNDCLIEVFCEEFIAEYNRKEIDLTDLCDYLYDLYVFYKGEK